MMYTGYASCGSGVRMGVWELTSAYGDPREGGTLLGYATNTVVPHAGSATHFSFLFDSVTLQNTRYYMWGIFATEGGCGWGTFGRNTGNGVLGKAWSGSGDFLNPANMGTLTNISLYPAPLSSGIIDFYEVVRGRE